MELEMWKVNVVIWVQLQYRQKKGKNTRKYL